MTLPFAYSDRYVVFFDILGFKDKVSKIEQHQQLFELLIALPKIISDTVSTANNLFGEIVGAQGTAFSDSIVISTSTSQTLSSLFTAVNTTVSLYQQLLQRGALARGGLAKGPAYHNDGIVFGQGMIAYLLEQNIAKVPRIAVAHDVAHEWANAFGRPGGLVALKDLIRPDCDGVDFIDLFHFPKTDSIDNSTFAFFKNSGPIIEQMLREQNLSERERSKIRWIAHQYNTSHFLTRVNLRRISAQP
jgi:hypothetical protein